MTDAFVCDAVRTPFGRYGGALSHVRADDLAAVPIAALRDRNNGVDWSTVDDVIYGCANQAGEDNRNVARMASLLAGLPECIPGVTVNRLCGSGMEAVNQAARSIRSGEAELVIAGGVESMSRAPLVIGKAEYSFARSQALEDTTLGWRFVNPLLQRSYGVESMPETAENVAMEYGVNRKDQDAFALRSQRRYADALANGFFTRELCSVDLPSGKGDQQLVSADEHPRPASTLDILARQRPIVRPEGSITAGNASGVNDGACALLIASEQAARRNDLTPRARILGFSAAGVAPRIMGIGPVPATASLINRLQLHLDNFDVIEINEAFAAQALAVIRELSLPDDAEQINPNGGAIAIGHPLGASGARLITTAIAQLEATGGRRALCTMCIGVGQGVAIALERV